MTKLKLSTIEDDKPVKLTIEIPAAVHRNLVAYAKAIGHEGGQAAPEPTKLPRWSSGSWRPTGPSRRRDGISVVGHPTNQLATDEPSWTFNQRG